MEDYQEHILETDLLPVADGQFDQERNLRPYTV